MVKITVKMHPNASSEKIEVKDSIYHVYTTQIAEKGKANERLFKLLSKHFDLPKSYFTIEKGFISRSKLVSIKND